MKTCPNCGYEKVTVLSSCEKCGAALPPVSTPQLDETQLSLDTTAPLHSSFVQESPLDTMKFDARHRLVLQIAHSGASLVMNPTQQMHIGRYAPENAQAVDIDLTPYGAWKQGVSRSHAMLYRTTNLFLLDLGSRHGTYIGTKRLVPYTPYILRHGDQIRLANLIVKVYFQAKEMEPSIRV
jgi:hypothetical protein